MASTGRRLDAPVVAGGQHSGNGESHRLWRECLARVLFEPRHRLAVGRVRTKALSDIFRGSQYAPAGWLSPVCFRVLVDMAVHGSPERPGEPATARPPSMLDRDDLCLLASATDCVQQFVRRHGVHCGRCVAPEPFRCLWHGTGCIFAGHHHWAVAWRVLASKCSVVPRWGTGCVCNAVRCVLATGIASDGAPQAVHTPKNQPYPRHQDPVHNFPVQTAFPVCFISDGLWQWHSRCAQCVSHRHRCHDSWSSPCIWLSR